MSRLKANSATPDQGRLLQVNTDLAPAAEPGHWFRLTLPRHTLTLPVLDRSTAEGWLAFHVRPDAASAAVGTYAYGTRCTLQGPYGDTLTPAPEGRRLIIMADNAGLPVVLFAARLAATGSLALTLALVEITGTPMVRLRPSRFMLTNMPPGTIAGLGPLEDAAVASRIAHRDEDRPGCHSGNLISLATPWLDARPAEHRWQDAIAVAGSQGFTEACETMLRGRVGQYQLMPIPSA